MNILCIGAHPDDIEGSIGGTAALLMRRGETVRFVSVTDGCKGHFDEEYVATPDSLVRRRDEEAREAAALIGAEYQCMGIPDGEVYITPTNTEAMVRLIREAEPDLVLLNRPTDYHRDHRYSAQLVLDATYMLTVPLMCSDTRHLARMPIFAYWHDDFTEGGAFRADVVVPIDSVIETKIDMACKHESQYFEWLPYNAGVLDEVPAESAARRERLAVRYRERAAACRDKYIDLLESQAGSSAWRFVEAFQISEYGRNPKPAELTRLFPVPYESKYA